MPALTLVVHPSLIRKTVRPLAYSYAYWSIQRVCTVRDAPKFTQDMEDQWRAHRDTLRSLVEDLPPVEEPDWPVQFLMSDRVAVKSHPQNIGGLRFNIVDKTELRKGAKQKPTYRRHLVGMKAETWTDDFMKLIPG